MKLKGILASAILMLVMLSVTLCFTSCDNINENTKLNDVSSENTSGVDTDNINDVSTGNTPEQQVLHEYKGLSKDNVQTINFLDYSNEATEESLAFTKIKSGNKNLPFLSKSAIKARFNDTNPTRLERLSGSNVNTIDQAIFGNQNLYQKPSYQQPYFAGEPRKDIMDLALARFNFIRRLAGQHEAVYNEQFHIEAQYGAWICAMQNKTSGSHSISAYTRPENISDDVWQLVKTGISQCMYLRPQAANSVDVYMGDNGNANLGHRVNLLNHYTSQVGFGVASANPASIVEDLGSRWTKASGATAFRFNWLKKDDYKDFEYDMVSWPPAGYFPAKTALFDSGVDKARWSIYFDGNKYALQTTADANGKKTNVIVTKKVDGTIVRTWNFAEILANNFKSDARGGISYGGTTIFYLTYQDSTGAVKNESFEDGTIFTVRFENLVDKVNGGFTNLEYGVEFFDMSKVQ